MLEVSSNKVEIQASTEKIYEFLSDFRNFENLMPTQVTQWHADEHSCSFTIQGLPQLELSYKEKIPNSRIVVTPRSSAPVGFDLGLFLLENQAGTDVEVKINAEVNAMMKMMLQNPLQNFVNTLAQRLKQYFESN